MPTEIRFPSSHFLKVVFSAAFAVTGISNVTDSNARRIIPVMDFAIFFFISFSSILLR